MGIELPKWLDARRVRYASPESLDEGDWRDIETLDADHADREPGALRAALERADTIWRLHDGERLVGFGAVAAFDLTHDGRHRAIFTSVAQLDRVARGRGVIAAAGLRAFARERLFHPRVALYWAFPASTWKTYRQLPRSFDRYWPRVDEPTPPEIRAMLERVAEEAGYADDYDPATGIAHRTGFARYREGVYANDGAHESGDPAARDYAQLNPRQHEGDTLLCLCPIDARNLMSAAQRSRR